MSAHDLYEMIHRRPFVAFRIIMSDGAVYEVRHPDLVMIGLSSVIIGFPSEQAPYVYSRWSLLSMRHIVRLEPQVDEDAVPAPLLVPLGGPGYSNKAST